MCIRFWWYYSIEVGSGKWEVGSGKWEVGSGKILHGVAYSSLTRRGKTHVSARSGARHHQGAGTLVPPNATQVASPISNTYIHSMLLHIHNSNSENTARYIASDVCGTEVPAPFPDKSVAPQHIPKLFTLHYSPFTYPSTRDTPYSPRYSHKWITVFSPSKLTTL